MSCNNAIDRLIPDTNQLNKTRTRSYDNVGNLTQTVDRDGRSISYNYDTLNRQTAERWLDASNAIDRLITDTNQLNKTRTRSYDNVGNLTQTADCLTHL
jgi:YD repeat-containing protein